MTNERIKRAKEEWLTLKCEIYVRIFLGSPSRYALFAEGFKRLEPVEK